MSFVPFAAIAAIGAAGMAAAAPVATFAITDGSVAYAATADGETLALSGSFRGERAPGFDVDAVNRYVLFAELTASIDGGDPVTSGGGLPATAPTTLRALVAEAEAALRDALAGGGAVGGDGAAEDEGGSTIGAVGGSTSGDEVGGGAGGLGGATTGGATGAGVGGSGGPRLGGVAPPDGGAATAEADASDRLLAILTDPDPTPEPIGDGLSFGFGFDLADGGPDVLMGDFEALLLSAEPDGRLDPGFDAARFTLDLAIDVAAVPLPAGLPFLVAGLGTLGAAARRRT